MLTTVNKISYPEIVIGLVSPLGVDATSTTRRLRSFFRNREYKVHEIKLSDHFETIRQNSSIDSPLTHTSSSDRIKKYIDFGNATREHFSDNAILALLATYLIIEKRLEAEKEKSRENRFTKNVYIISQFKREEEIDLMRSIYGPIFFQISIYSKRSKRVKNLALKFRKEANSASYQEFLPEAESLVTVDQNEAEKPHGQRVSKIFHDADFIVNEDIETPTVSKQVRRFCSLLFGSTTISPSKMEYGLFAAKSAALRSLDLSRQVGAAIFKETGEVIALGSNEVPKAKGGTYWSDEKHDDRDFKREEDPNVVRNNQVLSELFEILEIDRAKIPSEKMKRIRKSSFMSSIEYSRVVHAEMSALSDAARNGYAVKGSSLYTTTFPCHLCAKHIIASGVKSVIYLEPYPKSLAEYLFEDSIQIEGTDRGKYSSFPYVEFQHFYGITPRRYSIFFEGGVRKDKNTGKLKRYRTTPMTPIIDIKSPYYAQNEDTAILSFDDEIIGSSAET